MIDCPGLPRYHGNLLRALFTASAVVVFVNGYVDFEERVYRNLAVMLKWKEVLRVVGVVTKMDLVEEGEREEVFCEQRDRLVNCMSEEGLKVETVVPVAMRGESFVNVMEREFEWFEGPTFLEMLASIHIHRDVTLDEKDLRVCIYDVMRVKYKLVYTGTVESGVFRVGKLTVGICVANWNVKAM